MTIGTHTLTKTPHRPKPLFIGTWQKALLTQTIPPTFLTNYRLIPIAAVNTVVCIALPVRLTLIWDCRRGLDFETQIFAKQNAAELLRRELAHPQYRPRPLSLGINTDAYQPVERKLGITRKCLETLADCHHPVSLITKSALIERDLDLLGEMAKENLVEATVSITSLDATLTRKLEPRAAAPTRRLKIIERLAFAGVPTTVLMAPVIPPLQTAK